MIKIEFPADRTDIALALGQALTAIGSGTALMNTSAKTLDEPPTGEVKELPEPDGSTEPSEGDPNGNASLKQPASLFDDAPLAGTAEDAESTGTDQPIMPPAGSPADARIDEKGVAFNPAFCGEATDPFNKSGKNKGQWKKKRAVEQADYDAWYANELGKLPTLTAETATVQGSSTETSAGITAPAGALMVWISEKQADGLLTQDDVNEAYATTGVSTAELFGDNAAPHIAAIHTFLNARCVPA